MNEERDMKTKTVSARILSALSLPLCLAILFIFLLSACGGDTPLVPSGEPQEWSDPSGDESAAWTAEADVSSRPENGESAAWEADAPPESAAPLSVPKSMPVPGATMFQQSSTQSSKQIAFFIRCPPLRLF